MANLACGFDILGLALEGAGDEVTVERAGPPGVRLVEISGDGGQLPVEPERNSASVVVAAVARQVDPSAGIEVRLAKGLPLRSGLGSSAASSVAAAVATRALLAPGMPDRELLPLALEGEKVAAGAAHADNAGAALQGGLVLIRPVQPPELISLPVPQGLTCAVVRPHMEVDTGEARRLLGNQVELARAAVQWGNAAAFVAALFRNDLDLLSRCLVDVVAEPVRAPLVRGFAAVRAAALGAGALGCSLSGSGPSMFALCRDRRAAEAVADAMVAAFREAADVASDRFVSTAAGRGARVVESL